MKMIQNLFALEGCRDSPNGWQPLLFAAVMPLLFSDELRTRRRKGLVWSKSERPIADQIRGLRGLRIW